LNLRPPSMGRAKWTPRISAPSAAPVGTISMDVGGSPVGHPSGLHRGADINHREPTARVSIRAPLKKARGHPRKAYAPSPAALTGPARKSVFRRRRCGVPRCRRRLVGLHARHAPRQRQRRSCPRLASQIGFEFCLVHEEPSREQVKTKRPDRPVTSCRSAWAPTRTSVHQVPASCRDFRIRTTPGPLPADHPQGPDQEAKPPQPVPQNPRLSAPSRRNRVAILRSRNRRRSPPGGRWADLPDAGRAFVQVDLVARHRPPAPASPVPVRLCRLPRTQTIEAEAVTPVGEVATTDDTIMQPAPSP
jgi:hypothetical protein